MERLGAISRKIDDLFLSTTGHSEVRREFCCNNHLISISSFFHPFSEPFLGLFVLVVVCTIQKLVMILSWSNIFNLKNIFY